jgi:hypothetical protein
MASMEAPRHRIRVWYKRIAIVVAISLIALGLKQHLAARRMEVEYDEALNRQPLRLELDLARPGDEAEGIVEGYRRAQGFEVDLRIVPPFEHPDEARQALAGLLVSVRIQAEKDRLEGSAKYEIDEQFDAARLVANDAGLVADLREGRYRVFFKVLSPARSTVGRTLRLEGSSLICGLEMLEATIRFSFAVGAYAIGVLLIAAVLVRRRKRPARPAADLQTT